MNLTAIITTMRHGSKDADGNLSPDGLNESKLAGFQSEHLNGDVMLFHSGVNRVKESIIEVAKHIKYENQSEVDNREELTFSDYITPYLHYLIDPKIESEYFKSWNDLSISEEDTNKRMQKFLDLKDISAEKGVIPSPKEMARRAGRVILSQIELASVTDSQFKTNFINGTHEVVIMSFLYYFMNGFDPRGEDFVKNIGGNVKYAEGFELRVYQFFDEIEVKFKFRKFEGEVDLKLLREKIGY